MGGALRFLRWAFFCLCFLVFPWLVINLGVRHAFEVQWQTYTEREAARVTRLMESTLQRGSAETFYYAWLHRIVERAHRQPQPALAMASEAARLQRRFPDLFSVYVTDGAGETLFPPVLPPTVSRYSLRKLHQTFLTRRALTAGLKDKTLVRVLSHFWGEEPPPQTILQDIHAERKVCPLYPTGRRTYFYWYAGPAGGLFVHVHRQGAPPWFPLRVQAAWLNQRNANLAVGVVPFGGTPEAPRLSPDEARLVTLAIPRLDISPRSWMVKDDRLLTLLPLDTTWRFWSLRRLDPRVRGTLWQRRLAATSALAVGLAACLSFLVMVLGWEMALSIRHKLIGLFGISTGLPLVVLLATGFDYLHQTEGRLLQQTRDNLHESVKSFDDKFPKILQEYQAILNRSIRTSYREDGTFDFRRFTRLLEARQEAMHYAAPALVKRDGSTIRTQWTKDQSSQRQIDKLLLGLGLKALVTYNQNMGFATDVPARPRQIMAAEALLFEGETAHGLLHGFMSRIGEISRIRLAGTDRFLFFDLITDRSGAGEAVVILIWHPKHLFRAYLRRHLLRRQRDLPGSRLYALSLVDANWDLPPRSRRPWLRRFLERVRTRRTLVTDQLEIDGIPHLAAGWPGFEISDYIMVQTFPLTGIHAEIDRLRRSLLWFGLFSFALSIAVAVSLARQFLTPIGSLVQGVQLMREGKFAHRLPVFDRDELGHLSQAFNSTMESLEQLSVARTVQERLFPSQALPVGDFTIVGRSVTASELGGDYFDYFALGPDRAVILIGDVAGHGVASALLMAMAKAIVTQEVKRDPRPTAILQAVNRMIFDSFQKRSMMTFFYGLLDVTAGTLTYANAGHNHPYWLPAGGDPVELASSGFPLGTRKNPAYQEQTIAVGPGDDVWFYTDGIVETPGRGPEPLGYAGMLRLFADLRPYRPEDRLPRLYRACEAFRDGLPQPDDMTVILLTRAAPVPTGTRSAP
ncbi:MAG: Serine phosphatase RsbU, regulator of sigma subunit [Candidatus Ozemobacter sibiricus]|uniref:Serine phosphatase RsbU, regulator of sigma subunit n=1 Tax=Candidatus Ozemobacter sibiricus TaxID=2268124 RepID=A0A367ZVP8_9BACT|nr:MAG: Serine phosphatase RsbU, regulator of sigma subunit [Candidatus Ozemobacter sibiricus]